MIAIMKHLQQYVPTTDETSDTCHSILLGGDQLSTAMSRRVKAQRKNSTSNMESLEGLEPVCEDWHTKLCMLTVSQLYINCITCIICM